MKPTHRHTHTGMHTHTHTHAVLTHAVLTCRDSAGARDVKMVECSGGEAAAVALVLWLHFFGMWSVYNC